MPLTSGSQSVEQQSEESRDTVALKVGGLEGRVESMQEQLDAQQEAILELQEGFAQLAKFQARIGAMAGYWEFDPDDDFQSVTLDDDHTLD